MGGSCGPIPPDTRRLEEARSEATEAGIGRILSRCTRQPFLAKWFVYSRIMFMLGTTHFAGTANHELKRARVCSEASAERSRASLCAR
eukprot:1350451-Amphidinium_carterae.1